jgi:hypothetical protein
MSDKRYARAGPQGFYPPRDLKDPNRHLSMDHHDKSLPFDLWPNLWSHRLLA